MVIWIRVSILHCCDDEWWSIGDLAGGQRSIAGRGEEKRGDSEFRFIVSEWERERALGFLLYWYWVWIWVWEWEWKWDTLRQVTEDNGGEMPLIFILIHIAISLLFTSTTHCLLIKPSSFFSFFFIFSTKYFYSFLFGFIVIFI